MFAACLVFLSALPLAGGSSTNGTPLYPSAALFDLMKTGADPGRKQFSADERNPYTAPPLRRQC